MCVDCKQTNLCVNEQRGAPSSAARDGCRPTGAPPHRENRAGRGANAEGNVFHDAHPNIVGFSTLFLLGILTCTNFVCRKDGDVRKTLL